MDALQASCTFQLKKPLLALKKGAANCRPFLVTLQPGCMLQVVEGDGSKTVGLVDVDVAGDRYTVFSPDLEERAARLSDAPGSELQPSQ